MISLDLCCLVAKLCLTHVSPWTVARQVPLPMGFSRQEYWSGLPFPPPVYLPDPGIEPVSVASHALTGGFFTIMSPGASLVAQMVKNPPAMWKIWV